MAWRRGAGRGGLLPGACAALAGRSPRSRCGCGGRGARRRPRRAGGAVAGGRGGRELALERAPLVRVGHAGRQHLAALGPAVRRDSPGSFAPGHALATRAARTKSLRSGWPFEALGQQQRHEVRGGRGRRRRTSRASRARARPRPRRRRSRWAARRPRAGRSYAAARQPAHASRSRRMGSATTWAQTRKPVPGSSTALSQSK